MKRGDVWYTGADRFKGDRLQTHCTYPSSAVLSVGPNRVWAYRISLRKNRITPMMDLVNALLFLRHNRASLMQESHPPTQSPPMDPPLIKHSLISFYQLDAVFRCKGYVLLICGDKVVECSKAKIC